MKAKAIHIRPSWETPEIHLDPKGKILFSGRWIRRTLLDSNNLIILWIKSYEANPADITQFDFKFEYISSCGRANLMYLLMKSSTILKLKNTKVIINWYYEEGDSDLLELGEFISEIFEIPFTFLISRSRIPAIA